MFSKTKLLLGLTLGLGLASAGLVAGDSPAVRAGLGEDLGRKQYEEIAMGLAEGFGLNLIEPCIDDSVGFFASIEDAVALFESKQEDSVKNGLEKVGEAFEKFLPQAIKNCKGTADEVKKIEQALGAFKSPKEFAYHVGKDLVVNRKDIFENMNLMLKSYYTQVWQAMGFHLGLALKEVLIGEQQHQQQIALRGEPSRKEFEEVTMGLAEGFGLNLIETCIDDSVGFFTTVKDAIDLFESKQQDSVKQGLAKLSNAFVKYLPGAVKNCEGSEQEIKNIVAALAQFSTPASFAYHVGKDLLVNGVDIFHNMQIAVTDYEQQVWQAFGFHTGLALKEVLLGLNLNLKQEAKALKFLEREEKTLNIKPTDGVKILKGIAEGFGVTIIEECGEASAAAAKELEEALKNIENKDVVKAIREILEVVKKDLPTVLSSCKESVTEIKEIVAAVANLNPAHIAKDIMQNKLAIAKDVEVIGAELAHARKDSTYVPDYEMKIGFSLGDILKKILVGKSMRMSGTSAHDVELAQLMMSKKSVFDVQNVKDVKMADPPVDVTATDFLKGFLSGIGANVSDTCMNDLVNVEQKVNAFIADIANKKDVEDIIAAVKDLVAAILEDLPQMKSECGATVAAVEALVAKFESYGDSATALVEHVEKDTLLNIFGIKGDVDAALKEHDTPAKGAGQTDWVLIGFKSGDAVHLALFGKDAHATLRMGGMGMKKADDAEGEHLQLGGLGDTLFV